MDCRFVVVAPATEAKDFADWQTLDPGAHLPKEQGRAFAEPVRKKGAWQSLAEAGISLFPWW